jgi:tRNA dimethylallyltransferase
VEQVRRGNAPGHTVLFIAGPTASGKTRLGIETALAAGAEIVNGDSQQVYRGLDIGTAKPTPEQRAAVTHHLVDICGPEEIYSAGRFHRDAGDVLHRLGAAGVPAIVVGGSGLYLRSIITGLSALPEADAALRKELHEQARMHGTAPLVAELARMDPETAAAIDICNVQRLVRAIEVCRLTGKPYSQVKLATLVVPPWRSRVICLDWERSRLYARIEARVDTMIEAGLVGEVRGLLDAGVPSTAHAFRSVGYKEAIGYLNGNLGFDAMVSSIKQSTRNYAKRQLTWFRHQPDVCMYPISGEQDLGNLALKLADEVRSGVVQDRCR